MLHKCGQPRHFARECKQGRTGFFSCCAATSMKGDVVRDKAVFSSFESWNKGTTVKNPSGTLSRNEGKGSAKVEIRDCHNVVRSYTFLNVLFVSSYSVKLMSVSSAVARGSSFGFVADASHLLAPDRRQLPVKQRGKLFFPECKLNRNPMTLLTKKNKEGYQ